MIAGTSWRIGTDTFFEGHFVALSSLSRLSTPSVQLLRFSKMIMSVKKIVKSRKRIENKQILSCTKPVLEMIMATEPVKRLSDHVNHRRLLKSKA